ncbi:Rrf2 family transcriptional regulator [Methylacidiphilum kamchatkense Kam1]|uniref:Rrf2 family transcriptional regulator n=1 Tax=Methylacidiphilum kamchatkense Kam1 TaxID=1202785 RepID=A0A0C1UMP8_9BACT|nr:Rrf2 family transcriptional regulator [Methylacidiphilum kamchatkense]KIE57844.1 Rrf2 family transcriptional regulator [Methylacidiphilum kamchatkense Kam1]QDQ41467.1 BadM/Rrf2 family transcriptional regulator [Methylacidiphilum kamchatkense Kam1]
MFLTKRSKYALRALLFLAREQARGTILIQEIAEKEKIPKKFLESILLELKNNGLLSSRRGKGGGYALEYSPEKISIGSVIRLIDGPIAPVRCVSQSAYAPCEDCLDEKTCVIRYLMKETRDVIATVLDKTTLQELLQREDKLKAEATEGFVFEI